MTIANKRFCLRMRDFERTLCDSLGDLRAESAFFDVTLGCNEYNKQKKLQAHKVILSASSDFFKDILKQEDHPKPYIYLKGIEFQTLQLILDFIYQGEVSVSQEGLESFLAVTADLKIKGLVNKDGSKIGKGTGADQEAFDLDLTSSKTDDDEIRMLDPSSHDIFGLPYKRSSARQAKSTVTFQAPVESETEFFESTQRQDMVRLDNKWTCSSCFVQFPSQAACRRHVEKECVQNVFKCLECMFECRTNAELKRHVDNQHGKVPAFKKESTSKEANESELREIAQEFGFGEETHAPMESSDVFFQAPTQKVRASTRQKRNIKENLNEDQEWAPENSKPKKAKRESKKLEDEEPKEPKRKSIGPDLLALIERLDEGKCRCTECDKVFNSYVGIRQHLDVKHNEDADVFQCSICKESDKETIVKSKQKFRIHLNYGHEMRGRNLLGEYGILLSKEDLVAYKQKLEAMKLELEVPKQELESLEKM